MKIHYAHRVPSISFAFGLYVDSHLSGIISYGQPASPWLCMGICGKENYRLVLELNRVAFSSTINNGPSFLIAASLRMIPGPRIIVSYADTSMGHIGYCYQASNFLFTGTTTARTDIDAGDGMHSRHHLGDRSKRRNRSPKHRYVTFIGTRKEKRALRESLMYPVYPYPKGDPKRYEISAVASSQPILFP